MIIIGLLIGGVLKGQELVNNARIARTIKDFKNIEAGLLTFRDSYGGLPGDLPSAMTSIPNCNTSTNCVNGDGNYVIGVKELVPWHYQQNKSLNSETIQFWKHLALADMIGGINTHATELEWGEAMPSSPLGGGYTIADIAGITVGTDTADFIGKALRLHDCPLSCAEIESPPATVLSTNEAASIDRKIDDGDPLKGVIRASGAGGNQNDPCTAKNGLDGTYNENDNLDGACTIYFRLTQ